VVLPYGPREVNCCYDRSCNLSCPSCRTGIIVESGRREQIGRIQQKINDDALSGAEFLSITGSGDPFGSPFFRKWLRSMRLADMPKLKRLHLHTNAILWTLEMWETIPSEIRQLVRSTEISIDAARAETYAINRRGGDFSVLLRNLEFISGLRRSGPLEELTIHMVVQRNNFREIPEFVDLGRRVGADRIYFSQLVNWGTFSEEEFAERAVHLPSHADHAQFLDTLMHRTLTDAAVDLGNLTEVRRVSQSMRGSPS
jgi:MoaA/NifB/PqqE/SkfB family radical SAM enzyme